MTNPGEDCGVKGGCGACPLFVANVCGDPAPEPAHDDSCESEFIFGPMLRSMCGCAGRAALATNDLPGMWEAADFTGGLDEVRARPVPGESTWLPQRIAGILDVTSVPGSLPAAYTEPVPVCVQTDSGIVACGAADYATPYVARHGSRPNSWSYSGVSDAGYEPRHLDPDAPDCDPNEPRPEGAGCCGGGRCG